MHRHRLALQLASEKLLPDQLLVHIIRERSDGPMLVKYSLLKSYIQTSIKPLNLHIYEPCKRDLRTCCWGMQWEITAAANSSQVVLNILAHSATCRARMLLAHGDDGVVRAHGVRHRHVSRGSCAFRHDRIHLDVWVAFDRGGRDAVSDGRRLSLTAGLGKVAVAVAAV